MDSIKIINSFEDKFNTYFRRSNIKTYFSDIHTVQSNRNFKCAHISLPIKGTYLNIRTSLFNLKTLIMQLDILMRYLSRPIIHGELHKNTPYCCLKV